MRPNRSFGVAALAAAAALLTAPFASADELAVGTKGPDFTLLGVDGKQHALAEVGTKDGKPAAATVVVFTCNHCPFAKAWEARIAEIGNAAAKQGLGVVAINSNDPASFPDDDYPSMKARAKKVGFKFAYVVDGTSDVARAFGATVTPEAFLFDKDGTLVYHGTVDDNSREPQSVKQRWLREAVDAVIAGNDVPTAETKAIGCSIKYRKRATS